MISLHISSVHIQLKKWRSPAGFLAGDLLVKDNEHLHRQHKSLCGFFELPLVNFQPGA